MPSDAYQRDLLLRASYATGCRDATMICGMCVKSIKKTGGERQRSEGVKLLYRIIIRINESAMQPLQEIQRPATDHRPPTTTLCPN